MQAPICNTRYAIRSTCRTIKELVASFGEVTISFQHRRLSSASPSSVSVTMALCPSEALVEQFGGQRTISQAVILGRIGQRMASAPTRSGLRSCYCGWNVILSEGAKLVVTQGKDDTILVTATFYTVVGADIDTQAHLVMSILEQHFNKEI